MTDVHEPEVRSYNMSQIKGKNTKPEILVRKFLHSKGIRFRLHDKNLPGKPDIVIKKYKTVVQVHGCFWHGHEGCKYFVIPKTRTEWWQEKINSTVKRDQEVKKIMSSMGWKVFEIWECQLKKEGRIEALNNLYFNLINTFHGDTNH